MVANNVFPHVPDIRDFAAGLRALVKDTGIVYSGVPTSSSPDTAAPIRHHLPRALLVPLPLDGIKGTRHGGIAYRRCGGARHPRRITPGVCPSQEHPGEPTERVKGVLDEEDLAGLHTLAGHAGFASEVLKSRLTCSRFLIDAAKEGRRSPDTARPARAIRLLNHCGIREDLLQYTVDRSPVKQGKYLPGTHIPIYGPDRLD